MGGKKSPDRVSAIPEQISLRIIYLFLLLLLSWELNKMEDRQDQSTLRPVFKNSLNNYFHNKVNLRPEQSLYPFCWRSRHCSWCLCTDTPGQQCSDVCILIFSWECHYCHHKDKTVNMLTIYLFFIFPTLFFICNNPGA